MSKRNKTNSRENGGGVSPYRKKGKRPCQHCQDLTQRDRANAQKGQTYAIQNHDNV